MPLLPLTTFISLWRGSFFFDRNLLKPKTPREIMISESRARRCCCHTRSEMPRKERSNQFFEAFATGRNDVIELTLTSLEVTTFLEKKIVINKKQESTFTA